MKQTVGVGSAVRLRASNCLIGTRMRVGSSYRPQSVTASPNTDTMYAMGVGQFVGPSLDKQQQAERGEREGKNAGLLFLNHEPNKYIDSDDERG
jgi:hypothetical protein